MAVRYLIPAILLCVALAPAQDSKLTVSVVDAAGAPITDLKSDSFTVIERAPHPVTSATYIPDRPDVLLMIEASAFTNSIRSDIERLAILLIDQLGPKEQMAVIGYADSAELMQDFTSSKQSLVRAAKSLRYGNNVSVADAAYAALDTGFQNAVGRKILIIISGGQEGTNSVKKNELVDLAERRQVSIFSISLSGRAGFLEDLARETAGALLYGKELRPLDQAAKNLFTTFRGHYELAVQGSELAGKLKVEVKGAKEKLQVTHRRE